MIGQQEFRDAFGAFPTGVAVVTAAGDDGPVGLTTNALTSVSLDPPLFLVCFARTSRTLPVVREAGALAVSVLRDSQRHMAARFASKHEPAHKFQGIALDEHGGVPTIAGAAAVFVGTIQQLVHAGDHEIAICLCTHVDYDETAAPLAFHHGQFGGVTSEPQEWPVA
ncbi:MAG: flavin reductase family protein [Solirubrobacteraceae bacterium]|nr:flavin reductase family protein [Solirubrobacteraceae bacterium]